MVELLARANCFSMFSSQEMTAWWRSDGGARRGVSGAGLGGRAGSSLSGCGVAAARLLSPTRPSGSVAATVCGGWRRLDRRWVRVSMGSGESVRLLRALRRFSNWSQNHTSN